MGAGVVRFRKEVEIRARSVKVLETFLQPTRWVANKAFDKPKKLSKIRDTIRVQLMVSWDRKLDRRSERFKALMA